MRRVPQGERGEQILRWNAPFGGLCDAHSRCGSHYGACVSPSWTEDKWARIAIGSLPSVAKSQISASRHLSLVHRQADARLFQCLFQSLLTQLCTVCTSRPPGAAAQPGACPVRSAATTATAARYPSACDSPSTLVSIISNQPRNDPTRARRPTAHISRRITSALLRFPAHPCQPAR